MHVEAVSAVESYLLIFSWQGQNTHTVPFGFESLLFLSFA